MAHFIISTIYTEHGWVGGIQTSADAPAEIKEFSGDCAAAVTEVAGRLVGLEDVETIEVSGTRYASQEEAVQALRRQCPAVDPLPIIDERWIAGDFWHRSKDCALEHGRTLQIAQFTGQLPSNARICKVCWPGA